MHRAPLPALLCTSLPLGTPPFPASHMAPSPGLFLWWARWSGLAAGLSLCCCGAAVAPSLRGNLLPASLCLAWVAGPAATLPSAALARPLTLAQPLLVHPLVVKGLAAGNVALQWRWMPWALPVATAPCRVALAVMPPAHGAGLTTSPCAPTLTPTWPARCKGRFLLSGFRRSVGSAAACAASVFHAGTASTPLAALQQGLLLPPMLPAQALSTTCPLLMQSRQVGCGTLCHVPAAARSLWGRALSHALASVAHHNDERAWREFLMLPQCVLCPPPRKGRRHHKAAAAYTKDRLQRWLEGDRRALWEDRHQAPQSALRKRSAAQQRELAVALTREGFDRKACNALV